MLEELKKLKANFPTTSKASFKNNCNNSNNSWYLNGFSPTPFEDLLKKNIFRGQKNLFVPSLSSDSFSQNIESTLFNSSNIIEESFPYLGAIGDGGKQLNTDMLDTSMNNFFSTDFCKPCDNSVFSLNNPIWKPIFKDDDALNTLNFSSFWPERFIHNSNNNDNKKN